jgi:hypothetical protein
MKNLSKKNLLPIVIIGLVILCGHASIAQNKWSAELRSGVNYATKKLGTQTLKAGYGFEGIITYRFIEHLAIYTGWSWNNFPSSQILEGSKLNFNETGYSAGLQFIHPFPDSNISYLIKVGGFTII